MGDLSNPGSTRTKIRTRLEAQSVHPAGLEFFETYWTLIYSVCTRVGLSEAEAENLVHETVLAIADRSQEVDYSSCPVVGNWLKHSMKWRISSQLQNRTGHRDPPPPAVPAAGARTPELPVDFDQLWEDEWRSHIRQLAVARVKASTDPKEFEIYEAYEVRRLPLKEIRERYGVNIFQIYKASSRVSGNIQTEYRRLINGR